MLPATKKKTLILLIPDCVTAHLPLPCFAITFPHLTELFPRLRCLLMTWLRLLTVSHKVVSVESLDSRQGVWCQCDHRESPTTESDCAVERGVQRGSASLAVRPSPGWSQAISVVALWVVWEGGFVCFFVCFLTPKSLIVSVKNCWLL